MIFLFMIPGNIYCPKYVDGLECISFKRSDSDELCKIEVRKNGKIFSTPSSRRLGSRWW